MNITGNQDETVYMADIFTPPLSLITRPRGISAVGNAVTSNRCQSYLLWIDGVGAWQLCAGTRFTVGAPSSDERGADIALLANVSRCHAVMDCRNETWYLEAHHPTEVSGQPVQERVPLRSGDEIRLAQRVRLGFRVPSALSTSAVIDFESDHRPSYSVDGIILMTDHCLLGPRRDHHVWCSHWPEQVVLYHTSGQLQCRSKAAFFVNGQKVTDSAVLEDGSVVQGDEFRFRVERHVR
ncbi:MAG: FHA domain-containing protein [Planctomycetaceae bacterium]|nr:FHA domain-containing protein [Planctomycetaceae bacterium]